jgi:sulfate adenylyltransferase subunit 2
MPLIHLQQLEAKGIQIMREVVAETDNPVRVYSIGKDSAVLLRFALRAVYPSSARTWHRTSTRSRTARRCTPT